MRKAKIIAWEAMKAWKTFKKLNALGLVEKQYRYKDIYNKLKEVREHENINSTKDSI